MWENPKELAKTRPPEWPAPGAFAPKSRCAQESPKCPPPPAPPVPNRWRRFLRSHWPEPSIMLSRLFCKPAEAKSPRRCPQQSTKRPLAQRPLALAKRPLARAKRPLKLSRAKGKRACAERAKRPLARAKRPLALDDVVGSVLELDEDHWKRHKGQPEADNCPRCHWLTRKAYWEKTYP